VDRYASSGEYQVPVFGNYSAPSLSELTLAGNVLSPIALISMMQAVDPVYYPNAKFFMNAMQAWNLRSVTDANSRPLLNFMNGLTAMISPTPITPTHHR
jgi:HK97 family phage major capsid protein